MIDRVGCTQPVKVDIRIIATSNRNLAEAVREGSFREDLLYRLNVVHLRLPALRERPGDILALAEHFAKKYAELNGLPLRPIAADARKTLLAGTWRGNVRELENTMHRAVLLAIGPEITAAAVLSPEGEALPSAPSRDPAARAAQTAEALTRSLVGHTVADVERELILDTLDHCLGNRTHAAKILGISIRTLRNKLGEYTAAGISVAEPGQARVSAS
jgi:DNA-binding NtrC family response regulator